MGRLLLACCLALVGCQSPAGSAADAGPTDAMANPAARCSGPFVASMIGAEAFACVSGRVMGVYFSQPKPKAECFGICEDATEFGFGLVAAEVVPGASFELSTPGVGYYAEVSGTPSTPSPACFCATADFRPSRGIVSIIDYDGDVVCGTISDFLPEASGTFVVPIAPQCE